MLKKTEFGLGVDTGYPVSIDSISNHPIQKDRFWIACNTDPGRMRLLLRRRDVDEGIGNRRASTEARTAHGMTFGLGEAFQFDWSEEPLVVGGIYRRLQVSHLKLC